MTLLQVSIAQVSSWTVEARANATITLSDSSGLASFSANHTAVAQVSVVGFEDPVYVINTFGRVTNIINQTPYSHFIVGNSTANLLDHVTHGFYYAHNDSPSFLMRLQGDLRGSSFGIESLVNLSKLSGEDVPISSKTVVDYLYFGNTTPSSSAVSGMPAWFLLDNNHTSVYTS